MLDTIIKTISQAEKYLEEKNVVLDKFPVDLEIKDELAHVLENTALFADIIVRFPKLVHGFYKKNSKMWKPVMEKAIEICNKTGVYRGDHQMILASLQQELGIGEVDPNYKNPFKAQENTAQAELTSEERRELYKTAKMKKKVHERKEKRTGPQMSKREL
uniref:Coiled-coil domain-containing protein 134 n=1 Tax=Phallusia mammillata TaxID=59560 RepID=A0A6F9D910_9ASCI|nr:coiled-coil domain-containing protein 134 [Phallusia mammillata]